MTVDLRRFLPAKPEERFLHDVLGRLEIACDPLRIANQRSFEALQCVVDPFGLTNLSVGTHLKPGFYEVIWWE